MVPFCSPDSLNDAWVWYLLQGQLRTQQVDSCREFSGQVCILNREEDKHGNHRMTVGHSTLSRGQKSFQGPGSSWGSSLPSASRLELYAAHPPDRTGIVRLCLLHKGQDPGRWATVRLASSMLKV